MKTTKEQGKAILDNHQDIFNSQGDKDCQNILAKYQILIEKGIIKKRESQICSASDKMKIMLLNSQNYKLRRQ
jgi:hypothetical protein